MLKELLLEMAKAQVLKLILTRLPFLSFGPFAWILSMVIGWVGGKLFDAADLMVDLSAIKMKKESLAREFDSVSVTLKNIAEVSGVESKEFAEAKVVAKDALRNFIRFNS